MPVFYRMSEVSLGNIRNHRLMQKYIRQVTTQRSWIGRLIKVKLARVFFTLELSTAAQHCCVSSKAKEKYSQINAHSSANPGFGFLWNWLTPIKRELDNFLSTDSHGSDLCFIRYLVLLRICYKHPKGSHSFGHHLSWSEPQEFNW